MKNLRIKKFNVPLLMTVLLLSSFYIFNLNAWSSLSVIIITFFMILMYIVSSKGIIKIPFNRFHYAVSIFAMYCILSSFWAPDSARALSMGISIFEILICMAVVYCCFQNEASTESLLKAIMWSGSVIGIYTILYYGPSYFMTLLNGMSRIGNEFANANAIGMWAVMSVLVFLYFIIIKQIKWSSFLIIFPILLVGVSQSRTAFVELILGCCLLLFFRYYDNKSFFKGAIKVLIALVVGVLMLNLLSKLDVFSGLVERMERLFSYLSGEKVNEGSVYLRAAFNEAGWTQFKKTPFLGLGIDNSNILTSLATGRSTYLHNNFIELLACGGIVGFMLYYSIIGYLLIRLIPSALNKVKYSDICCTLLLVHTAADIGTVSYYDKSTYFLFLMCFMHISFSKKVYRSEVR